MAFPGPKPALQPVRRQARAPRTRGPSFRASFPVTDSARHHSEANRGPWGWWHPAGVHGSCKHHRKNKPTTKKQRSKRPRLMTAPSAYVPSSPEHDPLLPLRTATAQILFFPTCSAPLCLPSGRPFPWHWDSKHRPLRPKSALPVGTGDPRPCSWRASPFLLSHPLFLHPLRLLCCIISIVGKEDKNLL